MKITKLRLEIKDFSIDYRWVNMYRGDWCYRTDLQVILVGDLYR